MVADKWGRIIHISSKGGVEGAPGTIAYSTSKTALIGMSNVLAQEYARFNISSNVLVLGIFETGLFLKLEETQKQKVLAQTSSRKVGSATNIINAIKFIIESGYVNASSINIDGG
jgi:3-oxoacyl-[acyl-carrier protein] reductase